MKKTLILTLCVVLSIAFVACAPAATPEPTATPSVSPNNTPVLIEPPEGAEQPEEPPVPVTSAEDFVGGYWELASATDASGVTIQAVDFVAQTKTIVSVGFNADGTGTQITQNTETGESIQAEMTWEQTDAGITYKTEVEEGTVSVEGEILTMAAEGIGSVSFVRVPEDEADVANNTDNAETTEQFDQITELSEEAIIGTNWELFEMMDENGDIIDKQTIMEQYDIITFSFEADSQVNTTYGELETVATWEITDDKIVMINESDEEMILELEDGALITTMGGVRGVFERIG